MQCLCTPCFLSPKRDSLKITRLVERWLWERKGKYLFLILFLHTEGKYRSILHEDCINWHTWLFNVNLNSSVIFCFHAPCVCLVCFLQTLLSVQWTPYHTSRHCYRNSNGVENETITKPPKELLVGRSYELSPLYNVLWLSSSLSAWTTEEGILLVATHSKHLALVLIG